MSLSLIHVELVEGMRSGMHDVPFDECDCVLVHAALQNEIWAILTAHVIPVSGPCETQVQTWHREWLGTSCRS